MTETELYQLIADAKTPDDIEAKSEWLALGNDYSRLLTEHTLRAVYRYVYNGVNDYLAGANSVLFAVNPLLATFKSQPSVKTMHALVTGVMGHAQRAGGSEFFRATSAMKSMVQGLCRDLKTIVLEKFPDVETVKTRDVAAIFTAVQQAKDFEGVVKFINVLVQHGPRIKFESLADEYGIACLNAQHLEEIHYYVSKLSLPYSEATVRRSAGSGVPCLSPINPGDGWRSEQMLFPAGPGYYFKDQLALEYPVQFDFIVDHEDIDGHGIYVDARNDVTSASKFINGAVAALAVAFGREKIEVVSLQPQATHLGWEVKNLFQPLKRYCEANNTKECEELASDLKRLIETRSTKYGNFIKAARKSDTLDENIVIAIIVGERRDNTLDYIIRHGYRAGVIPIVVSTQQQRKNNGKIAPEGSIVLPGDNMLPLGNEWDTIQINNLDCEKDGWFASWIAKTPKLTNAWRKFAGSTTQNEGKKATLSTMLDDTNQFVPVVNGELITKLGEAKDDDEPFTYRANPADHIHAFIIGKTGSGKSALLNNILHGLISRYSPEDLELYLFDFKLGGVELNRYRDIKHVRALLVDNSDFQVVTDIMRDIENKMKERGAKFREAGCQNIAQYNEKYPESRMPQTIVVIDECHQIFQQQQGASHSEQASVLSTLCRIAKEGRSQGVHLIFATQTLAGSDIPSDILNNITDFYLMNCNSNDSERLRQNSSKFTSNLPRGDFMYYHTSEGKKCSGVYIDDNTSQKILSNVISRTNESRGNGQVYFNGSQTFGLSDADFNISPDYPILGKTLGLDRRDLPLKLKREEGENMLVVGLNIGANALRATLSPFFADIIQSIKTNRKRRYILLDSRGEDTPEGFLLAQLSTLGYFEYVPESKVSIVSAIAHDILNNSVHTDTLICILAQDKMKEHKRNWSLTEKSSTDEDASAFSQRMIESINMHHSESERKNKALNTFKDAISIILENGPSNGVHTIMQLDKLGSFLHLDYVGKKDVFTKFAHIVFLKGDPSAAFTLGLDDIDIARISDQEERLRAVYYCDHTGEHTLYTPYALPTVDEIDNLIKN